MPLSIKVAPLPIGYLGPYGATLSADGGTGTLKWTLIRGSLPPNLKLDQQGAIGGEATTVGNYPFLVQVADESDPPHFDEALLSLTIEQRNAAVTTEKLLTYKGTQTDEHNGIKISDSDQDTISSMALRISTMICPCSGM